MGLSAHWPGGDALNAAAAETVSPLALLGVLAWAVSRPRGWPEAVAAVPAAVILIAAGATAWPAFTVIVVALTLAGFAAASAAGVSPAWAAFAGAAVLAARALARRTVAPAALLRAADPPFLLFVLGLGIVVTAVTDNGRDPGARLDQMAAVSAGDLLVAAADRLGLGCDKLDIHGSERAVVTASAQADLLIVARDGDPARLGPKSLGKAARFVVDHATCPVLLVWPGSAPDVATMPPPPHHPSPPPHHPSPPGQ